MTDREGLLRACEERPGDRTQLLVAADWAKENGEEALERALRWMALWDRHPHRIVRTEEVRDLEQFGREFVVDRVVVGIDWMWTCYGGIREGLPHAALPRPLCGRLSFWEWRCWGSWEEAVVALGKGLLSGDCPCEGDPHRVEPETIQQMDQRNREVVDRLRDRRPTGEV